MNTETMPNIETALAALRQAKERLSSLHQSYRTFGYGYHLDSPYDGMPKLEDSLRSAMDSPEKVIALAASRRKMIISEEMRALNKRSVQEHIFQARLNLENVLRDIRHQHHSALLDPTNYSYQILASLWLQEMNRLEEYKRAGQLQPSFGYFSERKTPSNAEIVTIIQNMFGDLHQRVTRNYSENRSYTTYTSQESYYHGGYMVPKPKKIHSLELSDSEFQFDTLCLLPPLSFDRDLPATKQVVLASLDLAKAAKAMRNQYIRLAPLLSSRNERQEGLALALQRYKISDHKDLERKIESEKSSNVSIFLLIEPFLTAVAELREKRIALAAALDKAMTEFSAEGRKVRPRSCYYAPAPSDFEGELVLICADWHLGQSNRILREMEKWTAFSASCSNMRQDVGQQIAEAIAKLDKEEKKPIKT